MHSNEIGMNEIEKLAREFIREGESVGAAWRMAEEFLAERLKRQVDPRVATVDQIGRERRKNG